jgi:hypothetical protein
VGISGRLDQSIAVGVLLFPVGGGGDVGGCQEPKQVVTRKFGRVFELQAGRPVARWLGQVQVKCRARVPVCSFLDAKV